MRRVEVVTCDPAWPKRFREEALAIGLALGDTVQALHHIGSTAVPGLSAKPVIDILGVAPDLRAVAARDPALQALGYTPRGAAGIAGRLFYRKERDEGRSHHLHVFAAGSDHIRRHIGFRNHLASNPKVRAVYGALKEDLAAAHPTDIRAYMAGKDAFIQEIDRAVARGAVAGALPWPSAAG